MLLSPIRKRCNRNVIINQQYRSFMYIIHTKGFVYKNKTHHFLLLLPLFSSILILAVTVTETEAYSKTTPFPGYKPEELTHLHFYFHDVIIGDKPAAPGTNSTDIKFGVIMIADDPLTEGPDPSSKEVGRAQRMYASTAMDTISFTMVFNLAFTEGDQFNGSTLSMYGRNAILKLKVREMPIIGGTGAFRFARVHARANTCKLVGLDAVVE